jgi:C1A family cysteine protease
MNTTFCTAAVFLGLQNSLCGNKSEVVSELEQNFITHVSQHNLSYGTSEEYNFRLAIFAKKDAEFKEINANPKNTFTVGHNHFSTWTDFEFNKMVGSKSKGLKEQKTAVEAAIPTDLPESLDWRAKGAVNPVQNQGASCSSSWVFSGITAIEGRMKVKNGKLESYSVQQVIDCDT